MVHKAGPYAEPNSRPARLSDPTRREILNLLKQTSMTAGQIVEHFDTTGATISHHLNILRQAGLIEDPGSCAIYHFHMFL